MRELILPRMAERNQTKEASPATARQARHTTEKYSLLFSFCARRIFSSLNEKSIFLWCPALQVFMQVAGLASFLLSKGKAEFPPNPPSAFPLLKRDGNGSRRAKIPSPPNPLPFCPPAWASPPKLFGRRILWRTVKFFLISLLFLPLVGELRKATLRVMA